MISVKETRLLVRYYAAQTTFLKQLDGRKELVYNIILGKELLQKLYEQIASNKIESCLKEVKQILAVNCNYGLRVRLTSKTQKCKNNNFSIKGK